MVYNHLQPINKQLQTITNISTTFYNRDDNQLQWHCNKILGTVHNGLSTSAEGLLTKVQATTHKWYTLLPLAEFAYNNTPSAITGISPFFANKGYHPNLTVHPEWDLALSHARDLVVNMNYTKNLNPQFPKPNSDIRAPPMQKDHWLWTSL